MRPFTVYTMLNGMASRLRRPGTNLACNIFRELKEINRFLFSHVQGCPFCRAEIKGTESIVVDAFDPQRQYHKSSKQKEEEHDDENEVL